MQFVSSESASGTHTLSHNQIMDTLLSMNFANEQATPTKPLSQYENGDILQDLLFPDDEAPLFFPGSRRSSVDSNASFTEALFNMDLSSPESVSLHSFPQMMDQHTPFDQTPQPHIGKLALDMLSFASPVSTNYQSFFDSSSSMDSSSAGSCSTSSSPTTPKADSSSSSTATSSTTSTLNSTRSLTSILMKPRKKVAKAKSTPTLTTTSTSSSSTDPRPRDHECDVCHSKFLRHQDLHRHMATHSNSRDFACHYGCGSTFARSDAVTRHMKKKTCRGAPVE
ncbi:UNVERIFIED_CONTAM: hypothetical protein HDU68_009258 [Siphonaria sp. JEL0065]|nr:hypothetical protein HDU68_009258 [Siphonaria sp. JEL0065]